MGRWHKKQNNKAKDYRITNPVLIEALTKLTISGCKSHEKFIPCQYKYATITERYAQIAGIDGYWSHQIKEEINDRIEMLSEMSRQNGFHR